MYPFLFIDILEDIYTFFQGSKRRSILPYPQDSSIIILQNICKYIPEYVKPHLIVLEFL